MVSLLTPSLAGARRKPRFPACPGGVFVVVGDPLIPGGAPAFEDRLQLGGGQIAFSSGCPSTSMKMKPTRRGTKVRARWPSCPGLKGRVRLAALIEPITCSAVVGKLRAKKLKRSFQAVLDQGFTTPTIPDFSQTCGNGILEGGESCDDGNTIDCDGCRGDCTRPDADAGTASSSAARSATSRDARRARTVRDAAASRTTPRRRRAPRPRRAPSGTRAATPATAAASAAPRARSAAAGRRPATFRSARPARTVPRWATATSATLRTAGAAATASSPAACRRVTPCPIPTTCCSRCRPIPST